MAQLLLNHVVNGTYISTLDGVFYNDLDVLASLQSSITGITDGMYYQKGNVSFGIGPTDAVNVSQFNSLATSMSSNMSTMSTNIGSNTSAINALSSQVSSIQTSMGTMQAVADYKHSGQTADHGKWLLCDGRTISRTTYAALFAVLGTVHGTGDGSTTFNLPNPAGRSLLTSGQGLTTELGTIGTNRVVGAKGGSEGHVLTVAEMPAHSHTYTNQTIVADASLSLLGSGNRVSASPTANTSSVGGGASHTIMHPFIVVGNLFIYTG